MSFFHFTSKSPILSVEIIRELRSLTSLSIAELRERAHRGEALLEFRAFKGPCDETKCSIRQVLELIESGHLPLRIFHFPRSSEFLRAREEITSAQLRERLAGLRQIENKTQMLVELEEGYIKSPDEFVPLEDEDWTQRWQ